MPESYESRRCWLVDGMNVIGAGAGGWWRDVPRAIAGLIEDLRVFAVDAGEPVVVVFDHRPSGMRPGAAGAVKVRFAGGGRDAADRLIAEMVREDPAAFRVVTSDRALRAAVEADGAPVVGAGAFRRLMQEA